MTYIQLTKQFKKLSSAMVLASLCLAAACTPVGTNRAPSNNISLIISPTENELLVFDLRTHRVIEYLETGTTPDDLAVSSDGRRILVSNINDGSLSFYERLTGTDFIARGRVNVQGTKPQGLAFNSNGTRAYVSVGDSSTIATLNTANPGTLPSVIPTGVLRLTSTNAGAARPNPGQLAVSPDNSRLFVIDKAGGRLMAFNLQGDTIAPAEIFQVPQNIPFDLKDVVVDQTGRVYMLNGATDELLVFNGANIQNPAGQLSLKDGTLGPNVPISPESIALNHAGTKMYITGNSANVVSFIPNPRNLQGQQTLQAVQGRNIPLSGFSDRPATGPVGIDVTSDDRTVYVSNGGGGYNVSLIDGERDQPLRNIGTAANIVNAPPLGRMKIVFFAQAQALAVRSEDSEPTSENPVSSLHLIDNP